MTLQLTAHPVHLVVDGHPHFDSVLAPATHRRHPDRDAAGEACLPWLREMGLLELVPERSYRRARFHELIGNIYLHEDLDALTLASQFACLLFATDDLFDDMQGLAWRDQHARSLGALRCIQASARAGRPLPRLAHDGLVEARALQAIARAYATDANYTQLLIDDSGIQCAVQTDDVVRCWSHAAGELDGPSEDWPTVLFSDD